MARRTVAIDEVGDSALYVLSNLSRGVKWVTSIPAITSSV